MIMDKCKSDNSIDLNENVIINKCNYCNKIFISNSALYYHYKNIHNMKSSQINKEKKLNELKLNIKAGRPRKIVYEINKGKNGIYFANFFDSEIRKPLNNEDCCLKEIQESIVNDVFSIVYKSNNIIGRIYTYASPKEVNILNYILSDYIITSLQNKRTIDEILYEFYLSLWHQTNKIYLTNVLLFLMYLYEYIKYIEQRKIIGFSIGKNIIEKVPGSIQSFFNNFMKINNYFDIMKQNIEEWYEISKYFILWLNKNGYTNYELSNIYDE